MSNHILEGILRKTGVKNLVSLLSETLTPSELQSLMLEVYRRRARSVTPADLMRQYRQSRFVGPSSHDPRTFAALDQLAFSLLPDDCRPIELAPVCPLGTSSAVAPCDQNKIVATIRNTEVMADATNAMALECAVRRKALLDRAKGDATPVKLCASQRMVRAQGLEKPGFTAHFLLLALCTAGRDRGNYLFETESLREHIDYYLRLAKGVSSLGLSVKDPCVLITFSNPERVDSLQKRVIKPLTEQYPGAEFRFYPERRRGRNYYPDTCFRINFQDVKGNTWELVDGGFTDWTGQLLSNRKERLLISGIGTEQLVGQFAS